MKKLFSLMALLALATTLSDCGSSTLAAPPTTSVSGNWEATLVGGTGEASKLNFVTAFTVGSGQSTLDITSLSFFNLDASSCFLTVQGASGSANLTTSPTNQVTGSMIISVASSNPTGNVLTLSTTASNGLPGGQVTGTSNNGALANGVVTGNWTLTGGTGCTGQGTFLMCQGAATCTPTNT